MNDFFADLCTRVTFLHSFLEANNSQSFTLTSNKSNLLCSYLIINK